MGYPLDSKKWLTLLNLDNLLAYRTGKLPPTPRRYDPIPYPRLSPFLIRLHPTINYVFTYSRLLTYQRNRKPLFQPQLHTTKFQLKSIPPPKPTLFPLALLLDFLYTLNGLTPFLLQESVTHFPPFLYLMIW